MIVIRDHRSQYFAWGGFSMSQSSHNYMAVNTPHQTGPKRLKPCIVRSLISQVSYFHLINHLNHDMYSIIVYPSWLVKLMKTDAILNTVVSS